MERRYFFLCVISLALLVSKADKSSPRKQDRPSRRIPRLPGRRGFPVDDDIDHGKAPWIFGTGREIDLFDTRGGVQEHSSVGDEKAGAEADNSDNDEESFSQQDRADYYYNFPAKGATNRDRTTKRSGIYFDAQTPSSFSRRRAGGRSASSPSSSNRPNQQQQQRRGSSNAHQSSFFQPVSDWWTSNISPNIKNWPKIQCRIEPTTTLKIRKTFRPLKTVVKLGADFNTQLGVWQFKSSWEDEIIGGKITLAGRELQLTKSWQLSVGVMEDLVTRLRFRAAVDLQTWKAYARVGFRTERLSPINVMEGFTLMKQLPLDGTRGNVKLEVKANFALPEPEIEYSTETQRSLIGMGDIEVNIEELNLVLDY